MRAGRALGTALLLASAASALLPLGGCEIGAGLGRESMEPSASRLGINLSGARDWNTELPFVDVFRLARSWVSQREGSEWGQGPALDLDERGWIKSLAPGCSADALMCTIAGGRFPQGRYTCLYDGSGTVTMLNVARIASRSPGRIVFEPNPDSEGFALSIGATDPGDYVRNIRVIMPGFEEDYADRIFNPSFLERWRSFRVFRFMDWMDTNGSKTAAWEDRPRVDDAVWTVKGVPLEIMIELCNRTGIDPWFCMPHRATDDYVWRFARQVGEELDRSRKVYVEYSNEVWNSGFEQTDYACDEGTRLGLSADRFQAGLLFSSRRSVDIFGIWTRELGGADRLVRVMASQAANPWVSEQKLSFEGAYRECDALAIAPYMTLCPSPSSTPSAEEVGGWPVDRVLDYIEDAALPECVGWMRASRETADRYGVELIAYEAGQHAVGIQGGENVDAATRVFMAANRHERMGRIYRRYLDSWELEGGGLCSLFSSVEGWSKWGSWGLLEYFDDDTPKFRAVDDWNRSHALGGR
jgi:hypothetical protein